MPLLPAAALCPTLLFNLPAVPHPKHGSCRRPAAVSKRFRRLYLTSPALWQEITIEASPEVAHLSAAAMSAWQQAKSALLRRTAGMTRSVRLHSPGPEPGEPPAVWRVVGASMGSLLADLPSLALESLDIQVWHLAVNPAASRALASLPALKRLFICPAFEREEPGMFGLSFLAPQLPASAQLESLLLLALHLPPHVVTALPSLRRLTSLRIGTEEPLPQQLAERLQELPGLQDLVMSEEASTAEGLLPPGSLFTHEQSLTSFSLRAVRIQASHAMGQGHAPAAAAVTGAVGLRTCAACPQVPLPCGRRGRQCKLLARINDDCQPRLPHPCLAGAHRSWLQQYRARMPSWRPARGPRQAGDAQGALFLLRL